MLTTMTVIVGLVGSACVVMLALRYSARPARSVTPILSDPESPPKR
jgi:hypothetical protein